MSDHYTVDDITLCDDGTLDTVVEYTCHQCGRTHELRYGDTADYRSPRTGALHERSFFRDVVLPDIESEECIGADSHSLW